MSWRRHRFTSLQLQDTNDSIVAGSQFIVKRVGSTCVNDLEAQTSCEIGLEFYKDLLELFQWEHACMLRLIVDLTGAVLYDKNGNALQRFALQDIRDVIYSTKKEEYSQYFILVGREESELNVKAHVLFCEDKCKTKLLYDTFTQVFALVAERKQYRRQTSACHGQMKSEAGNNSMQGRGTLNAKDTNAKLPRYQAGTNSTITRPGLRKDQFFLEKDVDDSFTQLARSRSSSSTSRSSDIIDVHSNQIVLLDSNVFM